jgi:hypothetical protein
VRDFDAFMVSKGLGSEYALVYGSTLGALRNHTVLPHTEDIDIALSVHAAEALSQNSTRLELWAAGYAFWYGDFFRVCPHIWHPSPDFQDRMEPYTHQQWMQMYNYVAPVYMDAYLMWPKNSSSKYCDRVDFEGSTLEAETAYMDRMHLLKGQNHRGNSTHLVTVTSTTGTQPFGSTAQATTSTGGQQSSSDTTEEAQQVDTSTYVPVGSSGRVTDYCVWGSQLPLSLQEGAKPLEVGGSSFPAPINIKE